MRFIFSSKVNNRKNPAPSVMKSYTAQRCKSKYIYQALTA
ncbi:hypothetical protein L579_2897 [Pantoea sp. AS-PWVM4]|nr:hypothetical protein L579_2897 [Pantoea sp. AS-PWVM4]